MYIQCTKVMLDKVDTKKTRLVSVDNCDDGGNGFYSWHVHCITVNRRKVIVCMNNLTRYTIVLYRPKPKDIVELEDRIKEGVRTAFKEEGVPPKWWKRISEIAGQLNTPKQREETWLPV